MAIEQDVLAVHATAQRRGILALHGIHADVGVFRTAAGDMPREARALFHDQHVGGAQRQHLGARVAGHFDRRVIDRQDAQRVARINRHRHRIALEQIAVLHHLPLLALAGLDQDADIAHRATQHALAIGAREDLAMLIERAHAAIAAHDAIAHIQRRSGVQAVLAQRDHTRPVFGMHAADEILEAASERVAIDAEQGQGGVRPHQIAQRDVVFPVADAGDLLRIDQTLQFARLRAQPRARARPEAKQPQDRNRGQQERADAGNDVRLG